MSARLLAAVAAALLGSCSMSSNWHLIDSGYSIERLKSGDFAIEVHVNQLKQLGGDVQSAQFRQFVAEGLKSHALCPTGWTPLACVGDGSCVQHTTRSVTVLGRCVEP